MDLERLLKGLGYFAFGMICAGMWLLAVMDGLWSRWFFIALLLTAMVLTWIVRDAIEEEQSAKSFERFQESLKRWDES